MADQLPDPGTSELAAKILDQMFHEAQKQDLCPHCVGVDLVYFIAREMTAYAEVDPGELFRVLHAGICEGVEMQDDGEREEGADDGPNWTVH